MSVARSDAGFSLLEILVAFAVFALVASVSVTILSASVQGSDRVDAALDRAGAIDRLRVVLRDDIGQLTARSVRDESGARDPILFAAARNGIERRGDVATAETTLLILTRGGAPDTSSSQSRSSLIRVEYLLRGEQIVRRVRAHPDAGLEDGFREQVLIDGVSAVELDVLVGVNWIERLVVPAIATDSAMILPRAVRLRYQLAGLGQIEHIAMGSGPGLAT
ncbi:type II secretion system minor pseudopilin GspJ [Maricaulis sp.]|uniref:type II secretion system minor pseudopilin GspJ n=1 Tax=Maricaulis sp. TaxID=1486257 RepID=UPI003A8E1DC2